MAGISLLISFSKISLKFPTYDTMKWFFYGPLLSTSKLGPRGFQTQDLKMKVPGVNYFCTKIGCDFNWDMWALVSSCHVRLSLNWIPTTHQNSSPMNTAKPLLLSALLLHRLFPKLCCCGSENVYYQLYLFLTLEKKKSAYELGKNPGIFYDDYKYHNLLQCRLEGCTWIKEGKESFKLGI